MRSVMFLIHTIMHHVTHVLYLTVYRTKIRTIWTPEVQRNEFKIFTLKELDHLTCTMW